MINPSAHRATTIARRRLLAATAGFVAGSALSPLFAQAPLSQESVAAAVQTMKAGDFLWAPQASPNGPVMVVVSLEKQKAFVYRNGVLIGISTVSTGAPGHATPTGIFTILQKEIDHRSNIYNDAPMPFMQRLTWSGVAMHAGNLPGYPASHGCIRLPFAFAQHLYEVTKLGLTVIITQDAQIPRFAPGPSILDDAAPNDVEPEGAINWTPERSPTGPVSIIISASDQRAVVLRNGVVIGAAPVSVAGPLVGIHAYTLASVSGEKLRWMHVSLFGETAGGEVTAEERRRLRFAADFRGKLRSILTTGATVLITSDSLASGSTGSQLTVLTGEKGQ